jgi:intracellular multiplication protein IcmP
MTMPVQPNPRAAWPSHDDNSGFFLVVTLIGLGLLSAVLWINFHGAISGVVMGLFHDEISGLRRFTDRFDLADRQMLAANPDHVGLRDLYFIAHDVGVSVRLPVALTMLLLAAICTVRAAPARFKRVLDMDGLIAEQAKSFPTTAAFARRHLGLVAPLPNPRPADYAQTPKEWLAACTTRPDTKFDELAVRRALAAQLGPRWRGVEHAAPHVRAMFAVFAIHLAERRAEAQHLLGVLSAAFADPGKDRPEGPETPLYLPQAAVARADATLRDFELRFAADRIADRHAYTHTALMSLLNASRLAAGVIAPGQFAWLKLVDRPLWYALQSLGFETEGYGRYLHPNPRVEAAGARDHWAAERVAGQQIPHPDIERAIDAIQKMATKCSPEAESSSIRRQ